MRVGGWGCALCKIRRINLKCIKYKMKLNVKNIFKCISIYFHHINHSLPFKIFPSSINHIIKLHIHKKVGLKGICHAIKRFSVNFIVANLSRHVVNEIVNRLYWFKRLHLCHFQKYIYRPLIPET